MSLTRVRPMRTDRHLEAMRIALNAIEDRTNLTAWRHHGLGLVQRYIGGSTRVHVWHSSLDRGVKAVDGTRHDHRFDLVSEVLAGCLTNHELVVLPSPSGRWSSWTVANASGPTPTAEPVLCQENLDIWYGTTQQVWSGQEYFFPKWTYHETIPNPHSRDGVVVTLVNRFNLEAREAHILCRQRPANGFAEGHLPAPALVKDVLVVARDALLRQINASIAEQEST